jgi:hypothetical protein
MTLPLAIGVKDQKEFTDLLEKKHPFKLKGTGPVFYHLGMYFSRDEKTLCAFLQPNTLISLSRTT